MTVAPVRSIGADPLSRLADAAEGIAQGICELARAIRGDGEGGLHAA